MEACYARCNCWTDFPDMGGQVARFGPSGQVVSVRWSGDLSGDWGVIGQVVRWWGCRVVRWSFRWWGGLVVGWLFCHGNQTICTIVLHNILCRSPMRLTHGASRTHVGAATTRYYEQSRCILSAVQDMQKKVFARLAIYCVNILCRNVSLHSFQAQPCHQDSCPFGTLKTDPYCCTKVQFSTLAHSNSA